jgi:hypothetical protein
MVVAECNVTNAYYWIIPIIIQQLLVTNIIANVNNPYSESIADYW